MRPTRQNVALLLLALLAMFAVAVHSTPSGAAAVDAATEKRVRSVQCELGERLKVEIDETRKHRTVLRYSITEGLAFQRWRFHIEVTYFYRDEDGHRLGTTYNADGVVNLDQHGRAVLGSVSAPGRSRKPYEAHASSQTSECHISGVVKRRS